MGGRRKLTLMIAGLAVLVLAGTVGVLAKTGKLASFADVVGLQSGGGTLTVGINHNGVRLQREGMEVNAETTQDGVPVPWVQATNSQGWAVFRGLPAGQYSLYVTLPPEPQFAGLCGGVSPFTFSENRTVYIDLKPCGTSPSTDVRYTLKGKVVDPAQNPLEGVAVKYEITGTNFQQTTTTNSSGEYIFQNIALPTNGGAYPSEYLITASKAGYTTATRNFNDLFTTNKIPLQNGQEYNTDKPIVLSTEEELENNSDLFTLKGRITDENGKLLHNAQLSLYYIPENNNDYGLLSTNFHDDYYLRFQSDNSIYNRLTSPINYKKDNITNITTATNIPGHYKINCWLDGYTDASFNLSRHDIENAPVVNGQKVVESNFQLQWKGHLYVLGYVGVKDANIQPNTTVKLEGPNGLSMEQVVNTNRGYAYIESGQIIYNYLFSIEGANYGDKFTISIKDESFSEYNLDGTKIITKTFSQNTPFGEIIGKDEIGKDEDEERFILNQDFEYKRPLPATDKDFDIVGKTTYRGLGWPNVQLTVSIPGTDYKLSTISHRADQQENNYILPNVPLIEGGSYRLDITLPDTMNQFNKLEVFSADRQTIFQSDDIVNDIYSHSPIFRKNIELVCFDAHFKILEFFSAINGEPIETYDTRPSEYALFCKSKKNIVLACYGQNKVENKNVVNYEFFNFPSSDGIDGVRLYLESAKYYHKEEFFLPYGTDNVYLIPKDPQGEREALVWKEINGINFGTYRVFENDIFSESNIEILSNYAKIIAYLSMSTNTFPYPDIFIASRDNMSGVSEAKNNLIIMSALSLSDINIGIEILIHEFGHIADFNRHLQTLYRDNLIRALNAARGLKDDGQPIKDSSGNPVKSCNNIFSNYQCFSNYAIDVNTLELWAEFFLYWTLNGGSLKAIYEDPAMQDPANAHCLNALIYLDNIMREAYPNLQQFNPSDIGIKTSTAKVLGATSDSNTQEVIQIFEGAGYKPVDRTPFNLIAPIRDLDLTPQQIADGVFLKENFQQLPTTQRLTMRADIAFNRVANQVSNITSSTAVQRAREAITRLNKQVEDLLKRIGINFSGANITGRITDQRGVPLAGALVEVEGKAGLTNNKGIYKIKRLQTGKVKIKVTDEAIGKTYYVRTITIEKNQKITKDIVVTRKRYKIAGIVKRNGQVFSGGKIVLTPPTGSSISISVNSNGKFASANIPEGKYKAKVYDSKNRLRKVINSGAFGDMNKILLKEAIDTEVTIK